MKGNLSISGSHGSRGGSSKHGNDGSGGYADEPDMPFYTAPDSAFPLPRAVWQHIDAGVLVDRLTKEQDRIDIDMTADEREALTTSSGVFISSDERDILRQIGGVAASEILGGLDGGHPD